MRGSKATVARFMAPASAKFCVARLIPLLLLKARRCWCTRADESGGAPAAPLGDLAEGFRRGIAAVHSRYAASHVRTSCVGMILNTQNNSCVISGVGVGQFGSEDAMDGTGHFLRSQPTSWRNHGDDCSGHSGGGADVAEESWVQWGGNFDAGAGDWREHGGVQHRQFVPVPPAAGERSGAIDRDGL